MGVIGYFTMSVRSQPTKLSVHLFEATLADDTPSDATRREKWRCKGCFKKGPFRSGCPAEKDTQSETGPEQERRTKSAVNLSPNPTNSGVSPELLAAITTQGKPKYEVRRCTRKHVHTFDCQQPKPRPSKRRLMAPEGSSRLVKRGAHKPLDRPSGMKTSYVSWIHLYLPR